MAPRSVASSAVSDVLEEIELDPAEVLAFEIGAGPVDDLAGVEMSDKEGPHEGPYAGADDAVGYDALPRHDFQNADVGQAPRRSSTQGKTYLGFRHFPSPDISVRTAALSG